MGSLLVLALIAALVGPYFIDWDAYRADFEKEATRILGQKVTVSGEAKARLLPFPSVTFEDVRVGDPEKPLATADRFSMDAELAPFLSGELLIFDMRLVNPVVEMSIDERGLPDWTLPSTGPVSPTRVVLENASIINGSITLRDEIDGRDWAMDGINASVSADSLLGPYRLDGSGWMKTTPLAFRVTTGGLSREGFSLRTVLEMERQGIELSVDGRVAEPEVASAAPYNGTFVVRPLSGGSEKRYEVEGKFAASPRGVEVEEYRGEFGPVADPYVITGAAGITGGANPRYHVEVTGNQVTLPDTAAAEEESAAGLTFAERLARIESIVAALPFPPVPGSLDVDLPAIIAGGTTIRDIKLVASPDDTEEGDGRRRWKVTGFEAQLPGRTTVEADGVLQLPDAGNDEEAARFAGSLVVASRQPSGLATWLTGAADEAIRRLPNAGFAADVSFEPNRQTVDNLEVILGPARLGGRLERISDPSRRATLDLSLRGEELDFDALEALSAMFVGGDGAARYADHDLDISLNLVAPDIRGIKLDTLDASIRSRDLKTEIDRLSVTGLFGASISATASLDRRNEALGSGVDATIVAPDGNRLIEGLAERFPDIDALARLREIAAGDARAFADTRLDIVGTVARQASLVGEASLSVSGSTGGTELSVTSTAKGDMRDPEKASVFLNASLENEAAERLFAQAGLTTHTVESPGPLAVSARIDGSLFDGMKSAFTLTSGDMVADLDGVLTTDILSSGFTGQLQIEANDIEPWLLTLGYAFPGTGLGTTADISAAISQRSGKTVLREIDAVLNASRITGDLTLSMPDEIPVVRGDLALEFVDAGPFFAIITGDPAAAIRVADPEDALEREFGPPILPRHDIEVGLAAGEVTFPTSEATVKAVSGTFVYRDNEMAFRDVTASYGGGTFGGLISLRNDGGLTLLNAQLTAGDLSVAQLAPEVGRVMAGTTGLALQLTGTGRSNSALLDSLTGSGVLSTGQLTVGGVNADGFADLIAEADMVGYDMTVEQMRGVARETLLTGETVLPPADYAVSVSGGEIRLSNASARVGDFSVNLNAAMDIVAGTIAGDARLSFDPGEEAAAGPQPEIALAFSSAEEGGFDVTRDFDPLTGYLTQRALEREQARVEALQARLLEKQRLRREVLLLDYLAKLREEKAKEAAEDGQDDARMHPVDAGEPLRVVLDPATMRTQAAEEAARRLARGGFTRSSARRGNGSPEPGADN